MYNYSRSLLYSFFRERVSGKNVHATISKDMGYARYTVYDTVAFKLTFVAFL